MFSSGDVDSCEDGEILATESTFVSPVGFIHHHHHNGSTPHHPHHRSHHHTNLQPPPQSPEVGIPRPQFLPEPRSMPGFKNFGTSNNMHETKL